VKHEARYAVGDLADLGGVSRRTVRYYVQEGLLPTPHGVGRGNHYGPEHLERLLKVKTLQEAGRTLDEIRRTLSSKSRTRDTAPDAAQAEALPDRTVWRRLALAPGVEINVSAAVRLPSPGRLAELAAWCRLHFPPVQREDEDA
jgi:DNA-binding transcriptional MerR regulator